MVIEYALTFIRCFRRFGMISGILVFCKVYIIKAKEFKVRGVRHKIRLRKSRSDRIVFSHVFLEGHYDLDRIMVLREDAKVIVDAGSNIGLVSVLYANRYPNALIISVEPESDNFELLKTNTSRYQRIIPLKAALWNENAILNISETGSGSMGYMVSTDRSSDRNRQTGGITIDQIMKDYGIQTIDILKIDIEGAEKEVFSSNHDSWLSRTRIIIIELHDEKKEGCSKAVFNALSKYSFATYILKENLVFVNRNP